jgi:hypothetical protein
METLCRLVALKFDLASQLIDKVLASRSSTPFAALRLWPLSSLSNGESKPAGVGYNYKTELAALRMRYVLSTSHLYHQAALGEGGRRAACEEFQRIVSSERFMEELDRLVQQAVKGLGGDPGPFAFVNNNIDLVWNHQHLQAVEPLLGGEAAGHQQENNEQGVVDVNNNTATSNAEEGKEGGGRPPRSSDNIHRKKKTSPAGAEAGRSALKQPAGRNPIRGLKELVSQYEGHEIDCAARSVNLHMNAPSGGFYNYCFDCLIEMSVSPETSELVCTGCGGVKELLGTVFDDIQLYNQEGQKAKSGSFNPNRHFRFWMDRILAREPEEELGDKDDLGNLYGEKVLNQLRAIVRRDRKILRILTVDDVRGMLKELGRTDLNKNVPLILRRLTGVAPPLLPELICQRVEKIFTKAIEIGERVRPPGRTNRNYYPYYIYKILDAIIPKDAPGAQEHRRVLYYIYMQGQDTLDKNDREWEEICSELSEIEWTATCRNESLKYRPL